MRTVRHREFREYIRSLPEEGLECRIDEIGVDGLGYSVSWFLEDQLVARVQYWCVGPWYEINPDIEVW